MEKITEITFLGRGGQGAKTAAFVYGLNVMLAGKHFKAFPEYGPERSGAPVKAFVRISDAPIRLHSNIYHPDYLVVLDLTLLNDKIVNSLKDSSIVILNAEKEKAEKIRNEFNLNDVYYVDATKISLEEIGNNYPNVPLLGALEKVVGFSNLENLKEALKEIAGQKWSDVVMKRNIAALERGFEEVKKL